MLVDLDTPSGFSVKRLRTYHGPDLQELKDSVYTEDPKVTQNREHIQDAIEAAISRQASNDNLYELGSMSTAMIHEVDIVMGYLKSLERGL